MMYIDVPGFVAAHCACGLLAVIVSVTSERMSRHRYDG